VKGFKLQCCVPLIAEDGMAFPGETWRTWQSEINILIDVLPESEGPWLTESRNYRWLAWTVRDEIQLGRLLRFIETTRQRFGVAIYYEHHPITFGVADL